VNQQVFKRLFFYFFSYEDQEAFERVAESYKFPLPTTQLTYFLQSYKLAFEEKHLVKFISLFTKLDKDEDNAITPQ
jgi:hypothetical protein